MAPTGSVGDGVAVAIPTPYPLMSAAAGFNLLELETNWSGAKVRFLVQVADSNSGSVIPAFWAPSRPISFASKETLGSNKGGKD